MKYLDKSFTVPTSFGKLTNVAYEVAVGLRCPICKEKTCTCKKA